MRNATEFIDRSKDFVQVPHQLVCDPNLTGKEKNLWILLFSFQWKKDSEIRPSRKTVADAMGWNSKDTVTQYYKRLEEKGYLKYIEKGNGNSASKVYLIYDENVDTPWDKGGVEQNTIGGVEQNTIGGVEQNTIGGVEQNTPQNKTKELDEKEVDNSSTNVEESELKNFHQSPPDKDYQDWTAPDAVKNFYYYYYKTRDVIDEPQNWQKETGQASTLLDKYSARAVDGATQYLFKVKNGLDPGEKHFGYVMGVMSEYKSWAAKMRKRKEEREQVRKDEEKAQEIIEEIDDEEDFVEVGGISEMIG